MSEMRCVVPTPAGPLAVDLDGTTVVATRFVSGADPGPTRAGAGAGGRRAPGFLLEAFRAYGAGQAQALAQLEVRPARTAFLRAVYQALREVEGTVTYGELAEMAGYPRAARAVGGAMAHNPVAVIVPCHRVLPADGTLGAYGYGPDVKARLLAAEGVYL
jgi:O-6-methylguanine DNA methyltransferase